jgi:hypothetical protein
MVYKPFKCEMCGKETQRTAARQKYCIDCGKINVKNYYTINNKEYYQTHRVEHDEVTKQWNKDHPEYYKNYYEENKEKIIKRNGDYQKENLEQTQTNHRTSHHKKRMLAFNLLGGQCINPYGQHKEPYTDLRCLQIDHIHGGGREHFRKRSTYGIIADVIKDIDRKSKYQLMCANCNWIKRFENNENGQP